MKRFLFALTIVAAMSCGVSVGAIASTKPFATATAVARRWQQPCRIYYPGGSWEYGAVVWFGMADSIDWANATYEVFGGPGLQPQPKWKMVGARVEVFGTPASY